MRSNIETVGNITVLVACGLPFLLIFMILLGSVNYTDNMQIAAVDSNDKCVIISGSEVICTIADECLWDLCKEHIGEDITVTYVKCSLFGHEWLSAALRVEPTWESEPLNTYGIVEKQ